MKILFICKHNKFRSRVAEAIFNELNKNKKIKAESSSTMGSVNKTPKNVINALIKKGYHIKNRVARKVDIKKINHYDLIVIVASNVKTDFFDGFHGKIIKWYITDCMETDINGIKERVEKIEKKVKDLVSYYR